MVVLSPLPTGQNTNPLLGSFFMFVCFRVYLLLAQIVVRPVPR